MNKNECQINILGSDNASEVYFILDENWEFICVNSKLETLLNMRAAEIIGRSFSQFVIENRFDFFLEQFEQSRRSNKSVEFETQSPFTVNNSLKVRLYPIEQNLFVVMNDVTKQKKVTQVMQDNYDKFVFLTETTNQLILMKEPKELLDTLFEKLSGHLNLDVYFNYIFDQKAQKLRLMNFHGVPETVGKEIEWLEFGQAVCGTVAIRQSRMIVEDIQNLEDKKVSLIKGLGLKAYACHPLISFGKFIGTLSFGSKKRESFNNEELDLMQEICENVAIFLDQLLLITDLKTKNITLKKTNSALLLAKLEAEKANRAKTDFLSMMSHELRTPLNSILGYSQILSQNPQDPLSFNQERYINKTLQAGRSLLNLINDLLTLVKIESGHLKLNNEMFNMRTLVNDSISMLKPSADMKNIVILSNMDSISNLEIMVDKVRINQIIMNLLSNAIKYSKVGGCVTVNCERNNDDLSMTIIDNGIGIDETEQMKIFEPFYRSSKGLMDVEGTGIGLAITKRLITDMGGTIHVESKIEKGSMFCVKLPLMIK